VKTHGNSVVAVHHDSPVEGRRSGCFEDFDSGAITVSTVFARTSLANTRAPAMVRGGPGDVGDRSISMT
jgi:hypothetical protein